MIFVLLGGGVMSFHQPPLLKHLLWLSPAAQLPGDTHQDFDFIVVHWCLCAETHYGGELFVFPLATIARFDSIVVGGMVVMLAC